MLRPRFPVETERLLLRPFQDDDLDDLSAMQSREDVTRYLQWGPRTRDEVMEQLQRLKRMTAIDDVSESLRLAGVLRGSGVLVGDFSLWRRSGEHRQGEIGFVTHPDHQGRGYATEASHAMLRMGFEVLGLHRITGSLDARNVASARVLERLGMRREAHLRENELSKGEWTDELIYAMLAGEWESRR